EAELQRVLAAIEQLSDDDFDLLILVAWEALSGSDIAAILHIPRGTVRSRLHRIRTELDRARSTTTTDRRTPCTRSVRSPAGVPRSNRSTPTPPIRSGSRSSTVVRRGRPRHTRRRRHVRIRSRSGVVTLASRTVGRWWSPWL